MVMQMPSETGTVLLIEDEPDIRSMLRGSLGSHGFRVVEAADGPSGVAAASREQPDAIIVDLILPKMSGEEVIQEIKSDRNTARIPIIILSCKSSVADRVAGLSLGVADYISKPFSLQELVLRVRAVLHRTAGGNPMVSSFGPFTLDAEGFDVLAAGRPLGLTRLEFKIMAALMKAGGGPVSRDSLLVGIWGESNSLASRALDTHMKRLRIKLGQYAGHVETLTRRGHRLHPENRSMARGRALKAEPNVTKSSH